MASFQDVQDKIEKSVLSSQIGKIWAGKRVRRTGSIYQVPEEERAKDRLVARDVAANKKQAWKRSVFLNRALIVEM